MDKLKNKMEAAQRNWSANDASEKRVVECLSNKSEPPSQQLLDSLVADTFDTRSLMHINRHIFSTLGSPPRNYKAIFKALTVIEHLCLYGSDRFVSEALELVEQVRKLLNMRYSEGGVDKGAAVRNKTQEVLKFLSSKEATQAKRKHVRERNVPGGQSNMAMAAFEQKRKEVATESGGGKKENDMRKSTPSPPKGQSRSSTGEEHKHSQSSSHYSPSSGGGPFQDHYSAGFVNVQSERTVTASASPSLYYSPPHAHSDSSDHQAGAPQFQNPAPLRERAWTDPFAQPIQQKQVYLQYPPQTQAMPHMYEPQHPHYPQNNSQQAPLQQMIYPPQQFLPQQEVGMAGVTPQQQQYWYPEQVAFQQPVDHNNQHIGQQLQPPQQLQLPQQSLPPQQPPPPQQWNQSQPCGGLDEAEANNSSQFTNLYPHYTQAQQPTQNPVSVCQETYVNSPTGPPQGNAINEVAVGHQNRVQQPHQMIPTFAAQAGAIDQLRGARNNLKSVGMDVHRQGNNSQPSVFEGTGVAVEKGLDQKHVDSRRANLTNDGEEIIVGTTVESSEFQNMHQKLRNTNLQ